jgi:hypothetical protein
MMPPLMLNMELATDILNGGRVIFVDPTTGTFIVPPVKLKVLAAPVVLYFPAIFKTPFDMFNVPPPEVRSSSFAFPIFNVPFAIVMLPFIVTVAEAVKAVVAEFKNNLPVAGIVDATLKHAIATAFVFESLNVPFRILKKPFPAVKLFAVISTVFVAVVPRFVSIL